MPVKADGPVALGDRVRARDVAREAARKLAEAGVPEPEASAEVLLCELLGIRRGELPFREVSGQEARVYEAWISRRENREPVQRILGYAYFRNLRLDLDENTLIPRPDTESVVEAALERVDARGYPCRVLDLGTGSGAIAVSIAQERPECEVHASDVSEAALRVAGRNASANGAEVEFRLADVAGGLEKLSGGLDLLVSNPPYVETKTLETLQPEVRDHDPRSALDGGPDGLAFYRRIFAEAPSLLERGADVVLEVGDGQCGAVLEIGRSAGFSPLGAREDLAGTPRAVLLRWDG
jgi:release factor glutamine methyltransferase